MISKIFHLTYKSFDLPSSFQQNLERVKIYYPEHQIKIYDDEAIRTFVIEHFNDYYEQTFERMPEFIMQVDTVRYMWMYIYGGIYCDFDIYFLKHLPLDQGVVFIEREWTYPEDRSIFNSVHNCFFASEPGHPIWLDLLEGIASNVEALNLRTKSVGYNLFKNFKTKKVKISPVFDTTGPNAISRIITKHKLLEKYKDVMVLPGSTLYQKGRSKSTMNDAHVIHQTTGSWKMSG
jgi:mannosyltransferase OCH1-like enzyme